MNYVNWLTKKGYNFIPSSHYALLSLLFFAGLELIYFLNRFAMSLSVIILILLLIGIALIRIEEGGHFHPTQVILPSLTAIALPAFTLFMPPGNWLHIYFICTAIIFFFVLKLGSKKAYPTWNWMISIIILFISIATIVAWRFHFDIPILLLLSLTFFISFLISLQSLLRLTPSFIEGVLIASCMSFVLTQIIWVLQWLPLYYLIQAGIVTSLYYVTFHLIGVSYERRLERKDVLEYIVIGIISLLIILLTAQWT